MFKHQMQQESVLFVAFFMGCLVFLGFPFAA